MKKIILFALMAVATLGTYAQNQTVVIKTNASLNCQKCTDRFKDNVPFFKGVADYTYDKTNGQLTITYNAKKTDAAQLRQQISKLGYDADNVKADADARAKLPACCRNAGSCGHDAKTATTELKCQGAANKDGHKCQHKCQDANKVTGSKAATTTTEHKCQGAANGEHKCQHKCPNAQNKQ